MAGYTDLLTIGICSNRMENLIKYSLPSLMGVEDICSVKIVLDASIHRSINEVCERFKILKNIEIVTSNSNRGHANLRNEILKMCNTKYLLFLDDDITFSTGSIRSVMNELQSNFDIVGLKLVAGSNINLNRMYITPNQYHYLAIHSEGTENTVWGACMAFNMEIIRKHMVVFNIRLGRQNNKFLSGEDTSFIKNLTKHGYKSKLICSDVAIHHVNESRLKFSSIFKRVFWQGVTEAVRFNIITGTVKEIKRNFKVFNIYYILIGSVWMIVFITGCFYGLLYRETAGIRI